MRVWPHCVSYCCDVPKRTRRIHLFNNYSVKMSNSFKKTAQEIKKKSCAETGTAIFAFFNVISASIGLLICLNILVRYIWEALTYTDVIDAFMWNMCLSSNLLAMVSATFAIILFIGINQKKPGHVLAYFIFGVIVLIALVAGLVALHYEFQNADIERKIRELLFDYYEPITHAVIGICIVYALLLTMICRTWFLMTSRSSDDHEKLVNDYYQSDWRAD